ncbi:hypothetical protein [Teredinibacter haidensis]|uniref:hypothetical protein n=1 Tax=Teredinibacter haidensis TaxID=2731755 RepID=UPI0009490E4A|nr:hypothetical protein [Teredinibacter haidensis]
MYAGNDPALMVDPSGNNFTIGGLSISFNMMATLAVGSYASYQVGQSLAGSDLDSGFSSGQSFWILLAAMAGTGSNLLDMVTSKVGADSSGAITMYHGSSVESLVSLLNGAPLSVASAQEQKFPGEGSLLGFFLTPDLLAAEFFGQRRGGGVIQFTFTTSAFNAIRSGSITQPIPPIGSSMQSPGMEMIVQPVVFPLFDSLRSSGQIIASPVP